MVVGEAEVTSETQIEVMVLDQASDDGEEDEYQLNKTLTPIKNEEPQMSEGDEALTEADEGLEKLEGDYTKRSGTYRKSKPSLTPVPVVETVPQTPEREHQLESADTADEVMTGDYTRRSGTFRKEKPSLAVTTPQSDVVDVTATPAQPIATASEEGGGVLQIEPFSNVVDESAAQKSGASSPDELFEGGGLTGLKRSTTFRKEKPTLEVSPILQADFRQFEQEEDSSIQVPTLSLTLPSPKAKSPTADQADYYPDSDDSDSVEESYLLVDDVGGGGVKRSGTFTKDRPANTLFGDDYF